MKMFNKQNEAELKDYLYNCAVHDGIINNLFYNKSEDKLILTIINPNFKRKITFTFVNIKAVQFFPDNQNGQINTILSFTYVQSVEGIEYDIIKNNNTAKDDLYFILQTFSGNEFHIISNSLCVNSEKT